MRRHAKLLASQAEGFSGMVVGAILLVQTFGPVLDFPAFDEVDLATFARLAAPDSYAT